jgi:Ca2+-binding RTX toxin-like protein
LAFTTTSGAGGTSLIGTSGVDTTAFDPGTLATQVFIGAQASDDIINLQTNPATNYTINGGTGADLINAAGFTGSRVLLDDGNDTITVTGTVRSSTISGLNGIDTININGGVNSGLINGNSGTDAINVNGGTLQGNTVIAGGQDGDTIIIGATAAVTFTGGRINGQDEADTITISSAAGFGLAASMVFGSGTINGGQGSDNITNADAANAAAVLSGDLGNDTVTGANSAGDTIFGGDGDDRLTGGTTDGDSITGGTGSDTFAIATNSSQLASGQNPVAGTVAGTWGATSTITWAANANGAVDVITDFTAGLGGDIFATGISGSVAPTALLNSAVGFGGVTTTSATTTYYLSGNWSSANRIFTVTANGSGADTLLV